MAPDAEQMTTERKKWWQEFGAILAGFGAVAAIHAAVVVPSILSAAENRAHELAAYEANVVREELRQRVQVAEAMHATYVTRSELGQLTRQLDLLQSQLGRIEERLSTK